MYPGNNVRGSLPIPDPEKMLPRNRPTHRFQFHPTAVLEINFSTEEIDATASFETP
jgi:hypothetical protein